jgi:hypothetical protein
MEQKGEKKKLNYQNGKIYTIRSHQTEKYYIGSTCRDLSKRLYEHKQKSASSKEILKYDDAYIELLELFPCNSKDELNKREGEFIRLHKDNCVNVQIAGRTFKEWCENNKEKRKEQKKQWANNNKEKIKEAIKKYLNKNKNII